METRSRKGSGLVVLAAAMAIGLVSSGATAQADCGRPANAIEAENCLPGHLASPSDASLATQSSVNRGETISFRVGAAAADRIDVYRLGDYQGAGARLVTTLEDASTEWVVPADAVSGIYVARRAGEGESGGGARGIVFVVRDDGGSSDILFQVADAALPARGRAAADHALARWLERNGYDVSYTTGADVARRGELLARHKVFLSTDDVGDWSHAQRRSVERARDGLVPGQPAPLHLAFFGGRAQARQGARIDRTPEPTEGEAPFDRLEIPAAQGRLRFWRHTPNVSTLRGSQVWTGPVGTPTKREPDQDDDARPAGLVRLAKPTVALAFHRRPGGALVFASGTAQWPSALDGRPSADLQQATVNLLADMGVEPATLQPGLLPAAASSDRTAPVSEITSPASGATVPASTALVLRGTATDEAPGLVAGIEVSTDGGRTWRPAEGRESWSFTFTPATEGTHDVLVRAVDDSGNLETPGAGIAIAVGDPASRKAPATPSRGEAPPVLTTAADDPPSGWYAGDMHGHRSCGDSPESITSMYNRMVNNDLSVLSMLADMGSGEVQNATQDLPRVTGGDDPISTPGRILHWDAEWHWDATYTQYPNQALGGHLVLLGLSEAEQVWEEYTYPVIDYAHQRGGIAGFAHMQYLNDAIPSSLDCCTPIEYPVEVALGAADFISEDVYGSESAVSAYYRLLNTGFRPGFAAGTDYPCGIPDVGSPLTWSEVASEPLTYRKWIDGIAAGRTVVSRNGNREFVNLVVGGTATPGDQINLGSPGSVSVTAEWIAKQSYSGTIEIVKNGEVVASLAASAGPGLPATLSTSVPFASSGWLAARRMGPGGHVVHTAAVFVIVAGAPVRASAADAQFYIDWMDNLLTRTSPGGSWAGFFPTKRAQAQARYQAAKTLFQQILAESSGSPTLTVTPPTNGTVTGSGINCGTGGSDCTETYTIGAVVPLTATPDAGYTFGGWTGACSGTGACSVTMTVPRTVGALFNPPRFTLTVTPPTGGTITATGINCGTGGSDCTQDYDQGTVVPLTATPATGYTFGGWTGACTGTGACSVTMTQARTVGATFTIQRFTLTVTLPTNGTITGSGINCGVGGSDCTQDYDYGTAVPLTATPSTGYVLGNWTGNCSGTGACSVTMTGPRTVGATFTIQRFTLTVTLPTNGTITGSGINCGVGGSDCTQDYDSGTVVALTQTPSTGYTFGGWTGACTGTGACSVTMTAARTVGATFTIQRYTLTVTPPTGGTITATGINCGAGGSDCTQDFDSGTVVPLTATPATGYTFSGWTGACTGTGACSVTMTAARTVGATFAIQRFTLTVTPPTNGTITGAGIACGTGGTDCTETYDYGTAVPLTATPDANYDFGGWTGACTGTGPCAPTMTQARTVGATFAIQRFALTVTPPTNGTITGIGIACGTGGTDCTETYDTGTVVALTAAPATGYILGGWTGACTGTGACSVTMTQARTVGATFTIQRYTLTVTPPTNGTITGAGIACGTGGADCTETYDSGTVVPLTATPSTGYSLSGWTGACTGTGTSVCSVTMTQARTVGATFTIQRFTLTVTPPTNGTIAGTGIACGTGGSDCTETYDYGTGVVLTAAAGTGYDFGGWTGACSGTGACSLAMTEARTVGATFTPQRFILTVTPPTHGTVTGTGIACGTGGADCLEAYDYGTAVPLTATPDTGYDFGGWTGVCTGTGPCSVSMTAARTVGATFGPRRYTLTVTPPTHGTISGTGIACGTGGSDCTQDHDFGAVVALTATPDTGYRLRTWTGACTGTGPCSLTMTVSRTVGGTFLRAFTGTKTAPGGYEGPGFETNTEEAGPDSAQRPSEPPASPVEGPKEGLKESPREGPQEGPVASPAEGPNAPGKRFGIPQAAMVHVGGEVRHPGAYAWFPGMTVRQLVGAAGGLTPEGAGSRLEILRKATDQHPEAKCTLDDPVEVGDSIVLR